MSPPRRRLRLWLVAAPLAEALLMKLRGYPVAGNLVVRCRKGHLFTTIWISGVSVKSLRLGWLRFQWCPVGRHWSLVTPVKSAELSAREERRARERRDLPLP